MNNFQFSVKRETNGGLPVLPLAGKNRNGVEKLITAVVGKAGVLTVVRVIVHVIIDILFDA